MADDEEVSGLWWVLVEYKYILAGLFLAVSLSQGWVSIPILNTVVGSAVELLKAAVPG